MTPQELKNSILQLAIQGKLVEQRPEEGTAQELYREIQAEKQQLIKAGKIKKEKPLPEIAEEEKPFEIPESWMWVRILDVCRISTGTKDANYGTQNGEFPFFTCAAKPIKCPGFSFDGAAILLAGNGDFNNISLYRGKFEAYQRTYVVMPIREIVLEYLFYTFQARWVKYNLNKTYGSAIPYIRLKNVQEYLIPLPPLAEQQRIVTKIEELLPHIDRYEQAWSRLEAFNKRFPDDMRKSILQLAIQGKLVEQRPEEGTGEELYREIQAEKQRLIKEGKIKKEKPLPEIAEEEKPFEIPESWKWVRLGAILSISSGDGLTLSQMKADGKYPVYGGNGIAGYHDSYNVSKQTLVIGRVGFYCGSTHITEQYAWVTDNAFITTFIEHLIFIKWLKHYIDYLEPRKHASSTAQPVISGKLLYPMLMPLPPLAEQKRIVARLEELLAVCERLK